MAEPETRDVVIRWHPWTDFYVCYATTYLPAWKHQFNQFATREIAEQAIADFNTDARPGKDCLFRLIDNPDDTNRNPISVEEFFAKIQ